MGDAENIAGGFILLARKIQGTILWQRKPSSWIKIWLHILMTVRHSESENNLPVGCGHFSWSVTKGLLPDVTQNQWIRCVDFLREQGDITTEKTARGIKICVVNYRHYQAAENYRQRQKKPQQQTLDIQDTPRTPSKPESKTHSWLFPYIALWADLYHSQPRAGHMAKYLHPLHVQHGPEKTLAHLRNYLTSVNPQHISLSRFQETFGAWGTTRKTQKAQPKADYAAGFLNTTGASG